MRNASGAPPPLSTQEDTADTAQPRVPHPTLHHSSDHEPSILSGSFESSVPADDRRLGDRRVETDITGPRKILKILGPGLISGASDDDPSAVGTYAATGAQTGYSYLWMALITYPMMAAIQGMCARIGLVSGRGLASTLRQYYPKALVYPILGLLVVATTFNVGADLIAIAAGINLLIPIPVIVLVPIIAVALALVEVFAKYQSLNKVFKWLALALLAYVVTAFVSHANWGAALRGTLIPHLPQTRDDLNLAIAILGTTISPYLFFWQAGQEVEEKKAEGKRTAAERRGASTQEVANRKLDVNLGMLASNIVVYFIILTAAATLHATGKTDVASAADVANALEPLLGPVAKYLFAFGFIGAGIIAVPVLTGATGYTVSETFGWRAGLDEPVQRAKGFYAVIVVSTILGMGVTFLGLDPIKALLYSSILCGLVTPPLLFLIVMLSNRRSVMDRFTNDGWSNFWGWASFALMTAATVAYLVGRFF